MITLLLSAVVVTLAGSAIVSLLGVLRNRVEALGLSMMLGFGLVTVVMFVLHLATLPIAPHVYGVPIVALALYGLLRLRGMSLPGWRSTLAPRSRSVGVAAIVVVLALMVVELGRALLIPNRLYDSITSFDLHGKIIAAEKVLRVSIFDTTAIAQAGGSYPPFTALLFAWGYQSGAVDATHTVLLPFVGFVIWIFGAARRHMGATSAYLLLALALLSPDFYGYSSLPLSNLGVAMFAAVALFYTDVALSAGGRREFVLVAVALALLAWTRADAAAFVAGIGATLLLYRRGLIPFVRHATLLLPALFVLMAWERFAGEVLGRAGASRLLLTMGWDWPRFRLLVGGAGIFLFYVPSMGFAGWAYLAGLVSRVRGAGGGPLFLATGVSLIVYTAFFYFVNPETQADLRGLILSSYRRGLTAFVVPMWIAFFISPLGRFVRARGADLFGVSGAPPASR